MNKEIENKIRKCCTFLIEQENGLAFVRSIFYPPVISGDILDFTKGGDFPIDMSISDVLDYKYIITELAKVRPITESTDYFNKHIVEYIFNAKSAVTGEKAIIKGYVADSEHNAKIWSGGFIYKGKFHEGDWGLPAKIFKIADKIRKKRGLKRKFLNF